MKLAELEEDSKYYLNTKKLYKIWFSKDPSSFLNEENKLRLVKLCADNPQCNDPNTPNDRISFIYSYYTNSRI